MISIPPLNSLLAFDVAARHLSFTKAAEELNITQGAVSKQVIALEHRLGVKLFYRKTRMLELTDQGEAFWPEVREAIRILQGAIANFEPSATSRRIDIRVPPTLATYWLIPRLPLFHRNHPNVDIRLKTSLGSTLNEYRSHKEPCDIAIVRLDHDKLEELEPYDFLMRDDHVVACTPEIARYLKAPSDLAHATLLHAITRNDAWEKWLSKVGEHKVDPDRGLRLNHYHFAIQAAVDGVGVVLAPYPLLQAFLVSGQLVAPFNLAASSGSMYVVAYDRVKERDARYRAFKNWLIEAAKETAIPNPRLTSVDGQQITLL